MYLARVEPEKKKLEVVCRSCRVLLLVKARYAGRRVPCASCRAPVEVPTEEDLADETAPLEVRPPRGKKGLTVLTAFLSPTRILDYFSFSRGSSPGTFSGGGRGAPPLTR